MPKELVSRTGEDCSRIMFLDIETLPDFNRIHLFDLPEKPNDRATIKSCPEPRDTVLGETGNKPKDLIEVDIKRMVAEGQIPPDMWLDNCLQIEEDFGKNRSNVKAMLNKYKKEFQALDQSYENAIRKLALGTDTCCILSIAYALGGDKVEVEYADPTGGTDEEAKLLKKFWNVAEQATQFFAYNGWAFDLPIILTRSAFLGIPPTRRINMNRYNGDVLDPLNLRPSEKQKNVVDWNMIAEREETDVDGGKVYDLFHDGEHRKIAKYNIEDVETMRKLFKHFSGYFWV